MNRLKEICRRCTDLSEKDIEVLSLTEAQLQNMADLCNADIFLDCKSIAGTAVVVAHAKPALSASAYSRDIVGQEASLEKEPAVYHALTEGMPVCDIKAFTQEDRQVRQNVCPVKNPDGKVIGVLVREKDVSEELLKEEKYETLAGFFANRSPSVRMPDISTEDLAIREVHHRVKNNLQLVASILSIQARNNKDPQVKAILKENVGRVQSIASIHDILTHSEGDMHRVSSDVLMERLTANLHSLVPAERSIDISFSGDSIMLGADTASSVALVVTELVTNALRHGYKDGEEGKVEISVCKGAQISTIIVSDDGCGFDASQQRGDSLGLSIIRATVQDKLKGKLHISSSEEGTKISFDFRTE
ncbi:MAG: sensor histidine kinase [Clostridia bacterium]|nr:sensor histidine kinase [Clostridia bacterium]